MEQFLTYEDMCCCKYATFGIGRNGEECLMCTVEGYEWPCEETLRYSDSCKWEKVESNYNEPNYYWDEEE